MLPFVQAALLEQTPQRDVAELCQRVKQLIDLSRSEMKKNYDKWDNADQLYRGVRAPDRDDQNAARKGDPVKIVMPITKPQVQTFVAFCLSVLN